MRNTLYFSARVPFGELVEVIFVGSEKGGIVAEAGTEAGVRGIYPIPKQVPGVKQAFFGDVISYGASCLFLENTHHMVWADAAYGGQCPDAQILVQMFIYIGYKTGDTVV